MRDFIAFCTLLACLSVFVASVIAMVRPMPKVGLGTRKRALAGLGIAVGLLIVTAIVIPAPDAASGNASAPASASAPVKPKQPSPAKPTLTDDQDRAVGFIRYVVMQNIVCRGGIDQTQSQLDKLASNRARPIDAYEEAKRGIKSCGETLDEYRRADVLEGVPAEHQSVARQAVKSCEKAAMDRQTAMQLAQRVLDGDGRLASASKYRELRDGALSDETACRMALLGLAERMKIPAVEVEFAQLNRMWK